MRYAVARCRLAEREEVYRIFVTDILAAVGGVKDIRYIDVVESNNAKESDVNADDIIAVIRSKLE